MHGGGGGGGGWRECLPTFTAMLGSSNETSMYLSPRLAASRARYCSKEWKRETERGRQTEKRERQRRRDREKRGDIRGRGKHHWLNQEINFEFPACKICTMHHVPPRGNAHSHEEDKKIHKPKPHQIHADPPVHTVTNNAPACRLELATITQRSNTPINPLPLTQVNPTDLPSWTFLSLP